MKNRQLIDLLRTLTREEHRALRRFAQSPYFCSRDAARKILIYLSKVVSDGRPIPSTVESLFRAVRLKSGDASHYYDNLQLVMMETVTDFLAIQRIRNDKLGWRSEKALTVASHEASTAVSVARSRKREGNGVRSSTSIEIGDQEFLIERLKLTADTMNTSQVNNLSRFATGLDALLKFAEATGAMQNRKVKLYADLVKVIQTADKQLWQQLVDSAPSIQKALPEDEAHDLFMLLLNVAIRYVNEGSRVEYLDLAQTLDNLGALSSKARIQHPVFVNTAVTAMQAGEFEWAESFIKRYRSRLSGERAKEVHSEVQAIWYFYQYWKLGDHKALDKSHDCLVRAQDLMHGDIFETYTGRKFLTMIYIERQEEIAARSLVQSTIRSLNRHKRDLGSKHPLMMRFFQGAQSLLDLPASNQVVAAEIAERELADLARSPWFGSKDWLLERLEAIAQPSPALVRA